MPTPEQQAERAAAWKAMREAAATWAASAQNYLQRQLQWRVLVRDTSVIDVGGSFTLDGVVYLPDGTTRAAP